MQQTLIDNRYRLVELLGSGGMAEVYLARDGVLERDVALKVLRRQYASDEEFVERFRQEARSAARLSHPNIVSVYDQGRSEGDDGASYYIAMEYVPGGTLRDRIRQEGALAPDEAAGVALQVAEALRAAHERGVIHRDIKPQNVLLTEGGDAAKVTDFGIARAASAATRMTRTGIVLGTAGYMSPEQAKGEPVGPPSDLYSLGAVLYEALTGNLPYEAESALGQAVKHISEPPPSPREANPEVPEALDAVTVKLLAKDPEERYPSAAALAEDLERIRSGLPTIAASSGKTEPVMRAPLPPPSSPEERTRRAAAAVRPPVAAPVGAPKRDGRRRGGQALCAALDPGRARRSRLGFAEPRRAGVGSLRRPVRHGRHGSPCREGPRPEGPGRPAGRARAAASPRPEEPERRGQRGFGRCSVYSTGSASPGASCAREAEG